MKALGCAKFIPVPRRHLGRPVNLRGYCSGFTPFIWIAAIGVADTLDERQRSWFQIACAVDRFGLRITDGARAVRVGSANGVVALRAPLDE